MSSQPLRILVVDDHDDNLMLLQFLLETEGYLVETANNGRLAIGKIYTAMPDLVLLDLMMPEMNGYDVTRAIRQDPNLHNLPIILTTADAQIDREHSLKVGANDVLPKPIDFNMLLTILSNWHRTSVA